MNDTRSAQRHRTLKGARIVFNDGRSAFDCQVRNLSDTGARLRVTSVIGVPDHFDLVFDDGQQFAAEIAWRKETEIGVQFT